MRIVASCYNRLQQRRGWLVILLVLLVGLSFWNLSRLKIEDSIAAMLPDGGSQVAADFQLLQEAPFARKVVIHLRATSEIDIEQLSGATEQLRQALPPPLFINPISGPALTNPQGMISELLEYLPQLLTEEDLTQLESRLASAAIEQQMAEHYAQLLQPQGMLVKHLIRTDPLQLHQQALSKIMALNPLPEVGLEGGFFASSDGSSRLILADTAIAITDAQGSRQLLAAFVQAKELLPQGITAELISGHAYTLANAGVIKTDMGLLLLVSGGGLFVLFLVMIRNVRALPVFLLPLLSMAVALLVVSWWFDQVSGITIGFGAVLLGITIDFGLHVYYALQQQNLQRAEVLQLVARPVLFGGLTTLAAFLVLLFSDLPGQRQIGLFAGSGIIAAMGLALLVLPHFISDRKLASPAGQQLGRPPLSIRCPWSRRAIVVIWLGICGGCLLALPHLSLSGELRKLSYLPAPLAAAEARLSQVWGDVRGRALIFASAAELQTALQRNEQLWQLLAQHNLQAEAVSLAPVWVSEQTAAQRVQHWQSFWNRHRDVTAQRLQGAAAPYGFAAQAFAPFFDNLDRQPSSLDLQTLEGWGLSGLTEMLFQEHKGEYRFVTLVPDRIEMLTDLTGSAQLPEGVTVVSQSRFGQQLGAAIATDFYRFMLLAGVMVVLMVGILFRRVADVVLALLPAVTGLIVMLGGMALLGLELNLFNVIASLLIIGLGVDYGIFMVCHGQSQADLASERAVLVSGLSTLIGFGALVLAQHPALFSIGLTLLLGISAAMPTAILVLPALRSRGE